MSLGTPRHRRPSRNRTSKSSVHGSAAGHDWVRPEAGQGGGCEARRKPRLFCPMFVRGLTIDNEYMCGALCTGVGPSTVLAGPVDETRARSCHPNLKQDTLKLRPLLRDQRLGKGPVPEQLPKPRASIPMQHAAPSFVGDDETSQTGQTSHDGAGGGRPSGLGARGASQRPRPRQNGPKQGFPVWLAPRWLPPPANNPPVLGLRAGVGL